MDDNRVSIGKVSGTYGVKGWVKIAPLTDFPERFQSLQTVILSGPGKQGVMEVEAYRPHQHGHLLKFKGIDSPEEARALNQALLQIDAAEVYPLPEGVYYHFQLQGLEVYDTRLGLLGVVSEILETGANDVYVVASPRFGEILIPVLQETILRVDVDAGRMEVALLPGLLAKTEPSQPGQ